MSTNGVDRGRLPSMVGSAPAGRAYALEDGGAIPDQDRTGSAPNTPDPMTAVKDTLEFTRRKFIGDAFGQGTSEAGSSNPLGLDLRHLQTDTPHLAEGGAIPDDDEDDATGAIGDMPQGSPQNASQDAPIFSREHGLDVDAALSQFPGNAKRVAQFATSPQSSPANVPENAKAIWDYLTGANAAPPDVVTAAEKHVDPEGKMDPNDLKLQTVATVKADHGDDAASSVLQHYRQKFDHFKAFAGAAAAKGNLESAVNAATQAFTNLPDGHKIVFEPNGSEGVVAHLQGADGNQSGSINLSLNQFSKFLRGKDSMFDNLMDIGSVPTLRKQFTGADEAAPTKPEGPQSITKQLAKQLGVSTDDVTRLYPSPAAQMALLQQQKQQERVNTINETKAKNPAGVQQLRNEGAQKVADTRAAATSASAETRAGAARDVQKMKSDSWAHIYDLKDRNEQHKILTTAAARQGSDQGRNAINIARSMLAQGRPMTEIDKAFKEKGVDLGRLMRVPSGPSPSVPSVAAPTAASTTIQQPGTQSGAMRQVRLPNGQVVSVPAAQ